ncbi:MAG TPA: sensor domain-containing diguanylate cyclase [Deltaproteobacteria bacterium]|nr:sensor domain-containing diguanylate cyclase [Deltaproteobacteria bacterium]HPR54702.1 sensor domain-containing diguanylate cyclase [Deltaproteobacteria bacterium]
MLNSRHGLSDQERYEGNDRTWAKSARVTGAGMSALSGMPSDFPGILPNLMTILTGVSLVVFAVRSDRSRRESRIFAICCIVVSLAVLLDFVGKTGVTGAIARHLEGMILLLVLCAVMLCVHVLHAVFSSRGTPWMMTALYAAAGLLAANELFPVAPGLCVAGGYAVASGMGLAAGGFMAVRSLKGKGPSLSRSRGTLLAGAALLLILIAMEGVPGIKGHALGMAFVPLIAMSLGLYADMDRISSHSISRTDLISALVVTLGLMPLVADLIVLFTSSSSLNRTVLLLWENVYLTANIVSIIFCTGIALFCYRKAGRRIEVILVSFLAMLCAVLNLRDMITVLAAYDLKKIVLMNDLFLSMFIGVTIHLASRVSGMSRTREVLLFYGLSIVVMVILAWEALSPGSGLRVSSEAVRGGGHFVFIGAMVISFVRSFMMLGARRANETDPWMKRKVSLVLAGFSSAFLIAAASVVFAVFTPIYTMNFCLFLGMLLIASGVFYQDVARVNIHVKRQIVSLILRSAIIAAYATAIPLIWLILRGLSPDFIVSRIVPYGIPPLLSFVSAAFLSLFVLRLEQHRPETFPFSIICFCYAVLNLDILLVGIVPDLRTALWISRIDHFFLALLLLGANLHLVYLITGKKDRWWVVYLGYLIGVVMAPLALTDWYFSGMYTYYWGYFAKKAVLYDLMSLLWITALMFVIYHLFTSFRKTRSYQRRNIRSVLIAFALIAVLSIANTPAIYGYEVYPPGTFVFIALIFLTYGMFKFNISIALQYFRTVLLWTGLLLCLTAAGMAPYVTGVLHDRDAALEAGIVLVVILYAPVKKSLDAVIALFIRKAWDVLNEEYAAFTKNLMHIHHLEELHARMSSWIFEVFGSLSLTSLFSTGEAEVFEGWNSVNERGYSGLFGDPGEYTGGNRSVRIRGDDPLIRLCIGARTMITRAEFFRMFNGFGYGDWESGLFRDIDVILPVLAHENLTAIFLVGIKADGSRYSRQEIDMFRNVALFLGPHVDNTKLLENLEGVVNDRTRDLNAALAEAMLKERQIKDRNSVIERNNQIMQVLLETNTRMHQIETLEELFGFTLAQLKSLFPGVCGGIILDDPRRSILEASAFVGLSETEQRVILKNRDRINHPDIDTIMREAMREEGSEHGDHDMKHWKVIPLHGGPDNVAGSMIVREEDLEAAPRETIDLFIAQISSVVQNKFLLNRLERMASTDGLTGIYNRSFLDRELAKSIQHARRFRDMCFSLMMIDVNGLKQINDTYGHGVGDEVIVKVAGLLKASCRQTDIVSRIGGDEFAVLMPETRCTQAEVLLDRIRTGEKSLRILLTPSEGVHINIPIRISIGLSGSDESDPELVSKMADDIMYADKQRYYADQARAVHHLQKQGSPETA